MEFNDYAANKTFSTIERVGEEILEIAESMELNYIEACIVYADKHDIEYEAVAEVVKRHQILKNKLETDAKKLHYIQNDSATSFQYE